MVNWKNNIYTLFFVLFKKEAATSRYSSSNKDFPIVWLFTFKKVYAIAPPITIVSQLLDKDSKTVILEETFAPPIMATKGFSGLSSKGARNLTSFSIKNLPSRANSD